jgi:hypothetical protein
VQGTLFFVHGTGVRQEGYDQTLAAVKRGAGLIEVSVIGCPWGPKLGVSDDLVARALPPEVGTKSATAPPPSESQIALAAWALLIEDPLFELRVIASSSEAAPAVAAVNRPRAGQDAEAKLDALAKAPPALTTTGVSDQEFVSAISAVRDSDELEEASQARGRVDAVLCETIARAVTAWILRNHRLDLPGTEPALAMSGQVRDNLVQGIQDAMGCAAGDVVVKGKVIDALKARLAGFAESAATAFVLSRRQGLTGSTIPPIGDVLFYQRRGGVIADFVAEELKKVKDRPIVAVGHSLGGIILVDLLSRDKTLPISLLVTAGSQSPLFFAIDALETLRPTSSDGPAFVPWLNIYNPSDFLSFCASDLFGPSDEIWDRAVDPRVPFPASHSAYWHDDTVYELIKERWPALGQQ